MTTVVLPAYNCSHTLEKTLDAIPKDCVDTILLVDDGSTDNTLELARSLGIKHVFEHSSNMGYGANQKTCYDKALGMGADIVIMLHPDYQYDPKAIKQMVEVFEGGADVVFASRMRKGMEALRRGMPVYKFVANKALTAFQNLMLGMGLSEYHTGYRAYRASVLRSIDYRSFSDDFVFDNQMILALAALKIRIKEISCPAKYERDSSSINFCRSIKYGLGVVYYTLKYRLSL